MFTLSNSKTHQALSLTILILMLSSLTGCGDSNNGQKSFAVVQKDQVFSTATQLKGKVSNKKQAVTSGTIKAIDSHGKTVAETRLEQNDDYVLTIPANTDLPLELTLIPGPQSESQDKLIAVAIYPTIKKYDINDYTTLIAKKAKAMGGYTHSNMVLAADSTVGVPEANKTSTGFRGDPTKQYGGWH